MAEKMNPLFESMDIDAEMKAELSEAFDKAVLETVTEKMDEYVETKLTEEVERLEEEYKEKVEYLTEALDGYLDTVVEEFIEENAPMYEAQIEEEKTKTLLEMFDDMLKVAGVEMMQIAEAKEDASIEIKVEKLEEEVSVMADRLVEAKREADKYLKAGLIQELAEGLTILEKEKFEKLAEMVEFQRDPSYVNKLETIKESILDSRGEDFQMDETATLPNDAFKEKEADAKAVFDFGKYV
jgi:intergrase/recombinase